jgi:hypothetical protein
MADQLLDKVRELAEGQTVSKTAPISNVSNSNTCQDFEGQRLAEWLATALLAAVGVGMPLMLHLSTP